MLYDQPTLANAYLDAWLVTQDPIYRQPVIETLDYLMRDMRHPEGGYYSAEDAESYESKDAEEKREGAFYVWSVQQLRDALGEGKRTAIVPTGAIVSPGPTTTASLMRSSESGRLARTIMSSVPSGI